MTITDVFGTVELLNNQGMSHYLFAGDGFLQVHSKGVFAQNSNDEGFGWVAECCGRPFHKLGKVVEEYGLDLIFFGWRLPFQMKPAEQKKQESDKHLF